MAIATQTILAEGDSFRFIGLAVLAVVWIIGGIAKKISEQKMQRQQEAKDAGHPDQAAKSRWVQPTSQPAEPPTRREVRQPVVVPPQIEVSGQVETPHLGNAPARHVKTANQQRSLRLRARLVPEADTAAIGAKLGNLKQQRREIVETVSPLVSLDLDSVDALKRAIIHQEILSPPKALRDDQGLWED